MALSNPWALLLLLLLIPIALWMWKRKPAVIVLPTLSWVPDITDKRREKWYWAAQGLLLAGLAVLIVALADPKQVSSARYQDQHSVDIMMVLDASYSMNAEDFQPVNRLEVAKDVIQEFITKRPADRIGVVVFGGNAYTQTPLTFDHDMVIDQVDTIQLGGAGDGTAIGLAEGVAINRLLKSAAKTKLMILLTDGVNNQGELDPISAAQLAADSKIKIYTIGVGKPGGAKFKVPTGTGKWDYARMPDGSFILSELDEGVLRQIATLTGGAYYRAKDSQSLSAIYAQIDEQLKTRIRAHITVSYTPLFPIFIGIGIALILAGLFTHDFAIRSRL